MKIIVNGASGHMGQTIIRLIGEGCQGGELAAGVSLEGDYLRSLDEYTGPADIIIDFSHHTAVSSLLSYARGRKLPVVIATTGHGEDELELIKEASKEIPIFHAANMALGVALLARLAVEAARALPDADIEIVETHHNHKVDAPSGTALMLAKAISAARGGSSLRFGRNGQMPREKDEIGIHAVRLGGIVGVHEVYVTTPTQTITLKHEAYDRALFAEGALAAAAYLLGKPAGLYDMQTMISEA